MDGWMFEKHVYQHHFSIHIKICTPELSVENMFIHSLVNQFSKNEETLALPQRHCSNQSLCKVLFTNTVLICWKLLLWPDFLSLEAVSLLHLQRVISLSPCDPAGCSKFPLCQCYVRLKSPCRTNWTAGRILWRTDWPESHLVGLRQSWSRGSHWQEELAYCPFCIELILF